LELESKIFIAGINGMVGSAIKRNLLNAGYRNIIGLSSKELDLRDQRSTKDFFSDEKPEYVFLSAAKVGGILANDTYKADFLYDNLQIQTNVIHSAYLFKTKKLLFLGSSCIYPKLATQPLKEEYLLSGFLEPTNEPYAIAKIAGIKMCEAYRDQYGCNFVSVMPTNLYGPHDNYDVNNSHVLPALLKRIYDAKINRLETVTVWGTGTPLREFLHVDDLAEACVFLMNSYNEKQFLNIGSGVEISIRDLADLIKKVVGFQGEFIFDDSKPDGTPRKLLDSSGINQLGWKASTTLEQGITALYKIYF
jgi:GDP-L-fucose synthase